ncbi:hypothetical protein VIBHAR_05535 [Vibrio campbellii ATCC BAA-1116]|uniref:Uncharacterized protein n=1 Tax=Vibrio campbellii (strain ATCC BAA-1116) TaxID=2902295 RepID=A7N497_VIBC1|nr:hypothetical protein VIBHAR_05535 [Vibrio campbellii ATCC BAA-1116]
MTGSSWCKAQELVHIYEYYRTQNSAERRFLYKHN